MFYVTRSQLCNVALRVTSCVRSSIILHGSGDHCKLRGFRIQCQELGKHSGKKTITGVQECIFLLLTTAGIPNNAHENGKNANNTSQW